MKQYKKLEVSEAVKFVPYIWSLHFKSLEKDDYFVEPWSNNAFADCVEFRLSLVEDKPSEIYFFVTDTELVNFLTNTSKLYLYGAYGQVTVCQIQVKGCVTLEVDNSKDEDIRRCSRDRITARINATVHGISEDEAKERFKIIEKGQLFCFHPEEYAYSTYGRG